jgi:hypothetical protein
MGSLYKNDFDMHDMQSVSNVDPGKLKFCHPKFNYTYPATHGQQSYLITLPRYQARDFGASGNSKNSSCRSLFCVQKLMYPVTMSNSVHVHHLTHKVLNLINMDSPTLSFSRNLTLALDENLLHLKKQREFSLIH